MQRLGTRKTAIEMVTGAGRQAALRERHDALIEMVEQQIDVMADRLAGPHTLTELQAEAASLSSLTEMLSLRAEFVGRLLESGARAGQRESEQESVRAARMEMESFREEMLVTSNDLIRRAAALVARAHERMKRGTH